MATIQPFRTIISIFDCKIHLSEHSILIESKLKNKPAFLSLSSEIQIVYLFYLNVWLRLENGWGFSLIYQYIFSLHVFYLDDELSSCPEYYFEHGFISCCD